MKQGSVDLHLVRDGSEGYFQQQKKLWEKMWILEKTPQFMVCGSVHLQIFK
jgi:uncharacterized protein (DUF2252 family)